MYKTAVLFGGTGFIGRYIIQQLAQEGYNIKVATRDFEKAKSLKVAGHVGQVTSVAIPSFEDTHLNEITKEADLVINLLGILYQKGRHTFDKIHTEHAHKIAKACHHNQVKRFIHFSAIGADINSKSKYAKSKACGEEEVFKNFPEATIIRPSIVFGHEDNFFNMFARIMRFSPFIPLIGGGNTKFQPVYVGDIAKAISVLAGSTQYIGKVFELGGPDIFTFKEILDIIATLTERKVYYVHVPFFFAKLKAFFLQLLPTPPLTVDQVRLLEVDNIVSEDCQYTFKNLNINPRHIMAIVPSYLKAKPTKKFALAADSKQNI